MQCKVFGGKKQLSIKPSVLCPGRSLRTFPSLASGSYGGVWLVCLRALMGTTQHVEHGRTGHACLLRTGVWLVQLRL